MNIIVNSRFNPYNYEELVKPLEDYGKAYRETEQQYSDLVAQTETFRNIANQTSEPEAYALYKSFSDKLNDWIDNFDQGMTLENRRAALKLRRDYAKEILPIADADRALKEANAFRDKKGPDAIFQRSNYRLGDFLNGESANNEYISRKDLVSRTAALTQQAMQNNIGDPYSVGQQMLNQINLDAYDDEGKAQILNAINEGLYTGLDAFEQSSWKKYQQQRRLAIAEAKEARAAREDRAARGEVPIGKDKDGNDIYTNALGQAWRVSKEGITTEIDLDDLPKGGSNSSNTKKTLSSPLAISRLRTTTIDSEGNEIPKTFVWDPIKEQDKDAFKGAHILANGFDDLEPFEQQYLEQRYPKIAKNSGKFKFGYKFINIKTGEEEDPKDNRGRLATPDKDGIIIGNPAETDEEAIQMLKRVLVIDNK